MKEKTFNNVAAIWKDKDFDLIFGKRLTKYKKYKKMMKEVFLKYNIYDIITKIEKGKELNYG